MAQFHCSACGATFAFAPAGGTCTSCGKELLTPTRAGGSAIVLAVLLVTSVALIFSCGAGGALLTGYFALARQPVAQTDSSDRSSSANRSPEERSSELPAERLVGEQRAAELPDESPPVITPVKSFGATIPFARQPVFEPEVADLHYEFEKMSKFAYDVEYEVDFSGNRLGMIYATIVYDVSTTPIRMLMSMDRSQGRKPESANMVAGNGSGFFVRPDGYLVTNAHVVDGAVSISAMVDNETYNAKVVALNLKKDLALLRVDLAGNAYLSLADSDKVRLAEEVRAFGYPMVDRLGTDIKITRGTISGISQQYGEKIFQLDVTINPGNSGGPIVDSRGNVIGVATALMAEVGMADQGFAVTSNDVRALIDRHGIEYQSADPGPSEDISGPDLADRVAKSVVLLNVVKGEKGVGFEEQTAIEYQMHWSSCEKNLRTTVTSTHKNGIESGFVLVGSSGEVTYCSGEKVLPVSQQLIAEVPFQPLARFDSTQWSNFRIRDMQQAKPSNVLNVAAAPDLTTAFDVAAYETKAANEKTVSVKKRHRLSVVGIAAHGVTAIKGEGEFVFQRDIHRIGSLEMAGAITSETSPATYNLHCIYTGAAEHRKPIRETARSRLDDRVAELELSDDERRNRRARELEKRGLAAAEADRKAKLNVIPVTTGLPSLETGLPE